MGINSLLKKESLSYFISQLAENALYAAANGRLRDPKTLCQIFLRSMKEEM